MIPEVSAAGGVLWRPSGDGPEVAVVHRPRYDDWSLPKGKLLDGEHPLLGACREVVEETGSGGRPGRMLPEVRYGGKWVDYWAMRADERGDGFAPHDEVDRMRWLPVPAAATLVDYDGDRAVLADFSAVPSGTTAVLLVRHASAGDRKHWSGDDRDRPLDPRGVEQARRLAEVLAAYQPTRVMAAPNLRCLQTVGPLADRLALDVTADERLSEETNARSIRPGLDALQDLTHGAQPVVACSQGGLIPALVDHLLTAAGIDPGEVRSRKGSVWSLHLIAGDVVGAEYFADAAPDTRPVRLRRPAR